MLPDFVVIGTMKGGTTSLHADLVRHPQVIGALRKETHFVDLHHQRGQMGYRCYFPRRAEMDRARRHPGDRIVSGEATPSYIYHPLCPERLARLAPSTRLIALLREPVARAYSHYVHSCWDATEYLPWAEAIAAEEARIAQAWVQARGSRQEPGPSFFDHSYLARGRYAEQLERWLEHFPRSSLFVEASERYLAEPQVVLDRLADFLGLDRFPPAPPKRENARNYDRDGIPMEEELKERMRPHNQRLEELLGERMPW